MFTTSYCCIKLVLSECSILQNDCVTCVFSVLFRSQNKKTKVSSTMTCVLFFKSRWGGQGWLVSYICLMLSVIIIYSFVCFVHHNMALRLRPIESQMEPFFESVT